MIKKLINELMKTKTGDEILSYKPQIFGLYNDLYKRICFQSCNITNYIDIKMLHDLNFPMMAYYGPSFYDKCGIPFLKEHNPRTIDILDFIVLFYSLQVMNLLEKGFYNDAELCIYKNFTDEVFDHTEKINLTEYEFNQDLFMVLWFYFVQVVTIKDNTSEFLIYLCNEQDVFFLTDEKYEEVLDMIYKNINESHYSRIVSQILGTYRTRFTKMKYILEYQPLFVSTGYNYLCTLIDKGEQK